MSKFEQLPHKITFTRDLLLYLYRESMQYIRNNKTKNICYLNLQ